MRSIPKIALSLVLFTLGCNASSPLSGYTTAPLPAGFAKRQSSQCSTQCNTLDTNIDAAIDQCGDPDLAGPITQAMLQCLCKPALFSSFEACGQCLLDYDPTLQNHCDVYTAGTTLDKLADLCTEAGIRIAPMSLTVSATFDPSQCPVGGTPPPAQPPAPAPAPVPAPAHAPVSNQPSPALPPPNAGRNGGLASLVGPNATRRNGRGKNRANQNSLNWLSLTVAVLAGALIVL